VAGVARRFDDGHDPAAALLARLSGRAFPCCAESCVEVSSLAGTGRQIHYQAAKVDIANTEGAGLFGTVLQAFAVDNGE
jgi:hypothetical protein